MLEGEKLHDHVTQVHYARQRFVDEHTDEQLREWHAIDHAAIRHMHVHDMDDLLL